MISFHEDPKILRMAAKSPQAARSLVEWLTDFQNRTFQLRNGTDAELFRKAIGSLLEQAIHRGATATVQVVYDEAGVQAIFIRPR